MPQQLMLARLAEMPLAALEDDVSREMAENPSLERCDNSGDGEDNDTVSYDNPDNEDNADNAADIAEALAEIGRDDRPAFNPASKGPGEPAQEAAFVDTLLEQMRMDDLSDRERGIMRYLIYSLDGDGLLRKSDADIADELAIYDNVEVTADEVEAVVLKLQEYTPPGIGARTLRECLTIQAGRLRATPVTMLIGDIVTRCWDDFTQGRWQRVAERLGVSQERLGEARAALRRLLNPRPGAAMGETEGRATDSVTPDVVLRPGEAVLLRGRVPRLSVSAADEALAKRLAASNRKADREAAAFTQGYVDRARAYIEALRQRDNSVLAVAQAVARRQRRYLATGDEHDLRPMVLRDIAADTGLDISTVSRVTRSKYADTEWGTVPLRHFFSAAYDTGGDTEVSTRAIRQALREAIDREDPAHPLSDDALAALLAKKGYPIARRTVAKYREQAGIAVARLRRGSAG